MRIPRLLPVFAFVAVLVATAAVAHGSAATDWQRLWQRDMEFQLDEARRIALAVISGQPASAEAVAAASWWLENIDQLRSPDEVLAAAPNDRDPELGFYLGLIDNRLDLEAPPAAIDAAELAGAFGVFTTLDLERAVVPADGELPPMPTTWRDDAEPFRVRMQTLDGYLAPPVAMMADGIYLVAYDLQTAETVNGWLVVEANGSYNLEVDGRAVDRRRECGLRDPETNWYRLQLEPGAHRLRLEIGAVNEPRVRVSLLDDRGAPLAAVEVRDEIGGPHSLSEVSPAEPPAMASLVSRFAAHEAALDELLVAAQIRRGRGDPDAATVLFERAREHSPEDPWTALAFARHLFFELGASAIGPAQQIAGLLRESAPIPGALIFEHAVALQQRREEDAERLLDRLFEEHGDDVRILRMWVREAVRRGWAREADESLDRLEAALPGSLSVTDLRLEVLAALERWRERETLLRALVSATPVQTRWIGEMASGCLLPEALAATRALVDRLEDPDMDVQLIQRLLENSEFESARAELARARGRWGLLPTFDELDLMSSASDTQRLRSALDGALDRNPSNLQLLTLAWRQGRQPFFEEFRIDGLDFAAEHRDWGTDADAVLLLDQAVERIYPDGSSVYYYHGLTRANTPVGARRAAELRPLAGAHFFTLRIIKPDGRVVVPVDVRPGMDAISLTEVEPGDLVEEEYVARVGSTGSSRRGHLPPYLYRFADPNRAFGLSEYVLLVPPEIELQVDGNFEGLERDEATWRDLRLLRWRAERVPPVPLEPFAPSAEQLMPWLNYGFGVTWSDVGDTFRDRFLSILRTSPELRRWGRELAVGDTPKERIRSLVNGIIDEIDSGSVELAAGTAAADSFAAKRGNRLGILMAVLADQGWTVDLVLSRPWTDRGLRMDVPTLDAFPAALLRAAKDGDELWIDTREEERGVGHINPLVQGADGLVLPMSDPQRAVTLLDRLPTFDNPDLVEDLGVRAEISASGDARIEFRMALRGGRAEQLKERIETVPVNQVAMVYQQMASSIFVGASMVEGRMTDDEGESFIELEMMVDGACDAIGSTLECRSLVLSNPLVPLFASLPERTYPVVLQVPLKRRTDLEIISPEGWQLEQRPPRRVETGWGSVDESIERSDASVRSLLTVVLPRQTVSTDDYPAFARFCRAVDELTSRPPTLVRDGD
ncbi:MAG: hypothetical protein PVG92_01365 [Holophagae bacterium]|jgi:hypothetical protein